MTSQSPEEGSTVKEEKAVVKDGLSGRELWDEVRISPVEIAMPGGVGLTLRAYRLASELTPTEIEVDEDDPFDARERAAAARAAEEEGVIVDDEFAALVAEGDAGSKSEPASRTGRTVTTEDGEVVAEPDAADFADEPDEAEEEQEADEEVPMFLSHRGKLLTFKTPESLVSFIRSGAPHDLAQLDTLADRGGTGTVDRHRPGAGRPLRAGPRGGEPARRPRHVGSAAAHRRRRGGP